MANQIVTVNVTQSIAPAPSTLQQTGVIISQGGTTLTTNGVALLTQLSSITSILAGAQAITSMAWASNLVTVTTTSPHGYPNGDQLLLTIAGVTPAGYNGTFTATITGANTFTYPLASSPGTVTVQGTVTDADVAELNSQNTTFFAQGSQVPVTVLELGPGTPAQGVTALTAYMAANPLQFYSYLVPREWASEPTFPALIASYESTTAKQYFFVTVTQANYTNFTALMKNVYMAIEAPSIPSSEFSLAATFYNTLKYSPSSTTPVAPLCFQYVVGVTPYPTQGNSSLLQTFRTNNVNYVATGAEGGISNTMIKWGTMCDGNPFNYWYSVDWMQINVDLNIANEIINGSNNSIAPLYYDQPGVDRLQIRSQSTATQAVNSGLALGPVTATALSPQAFVQLLTGGNAPIGVLVNAVPFITYVTQNPNDFPLGKYSGLSIAYTPARGFTTIIFNINVSNFVPI
ncbi:hypothetical protein AB4Y43_01390 [Paraburkholderia sp. BR10872]|uniref:hypothetical protein n=1 Tax=Paraburkholderia sp. BR10872 TaxID=3236989 RepID=UPI0034D2A178